MGYMTGDDWMRCWQLDDKGIFAGYYSNTEIGMPEAKINRRINKIKNVYPANLNDPHRRVIGQDSRLGLFLRRKTDDQFLSTKPSNVSKKIKHHTFNVHLDKIGSNCQKSSINKPFDSCASSNPVLTVEHRLPRKEDGFKSATKKQSALKEAQEHSRQHRSRQAEKAFTKWLSLKKKIEASQAVASICGESESVATKKSSYSGKGFLHTSHQSPVLSRSTLSNTNIARQRIDFYVSPISEDQMSDDSDYLKAFQRSMTPFVRLSAQETNSVYSNKKPLVTRFCERKQLCGSPLHPASVSLGLADNKTYQQWVGEKLAKLKRSRDARNNVRINVPNVSPGTETPELGTSDSDPVPLTISHESSTIPVWAPRKQDRIVERNSAEQNVFTNDRSDPVLASDSLIRGHIVERKSEQFLQPRIVYCRGPLSDAVVQKPESWIETRIYHPIAL